jgi:hypothetical protein
VLYELLTGAKPFAGEGVLAQMHAHINSEPPRPSRYLGIPADLDDVIARAMAKNPEDRYPSAGALAAAAHEAFAAMTSAVGAGPVRPPPAVTATARPAAGPTLASPPPRPQSPLERPVKRANLANQRLCAAGGVLAVLVGIWGLSSTSFFPPPAPSLSADDVAVLYGVGGNNLVVFRLGALLLMFAGLLLGVFSAAIYGQSKRVEGESPTLSQVQLGLGMLAAAEVVFSAVLMEGAAFLFYSAPELTQSVHSIAWLTLVAAVSATTALQRVALGLLILRDDRHSPVLPRWAGHVSLWAAVLAVPGTLCVFFKTGPFTWNGLISWWLPFLAFLAWIGLMTLAVIKAINRQATSAAASY